MARAAQETEQGRAPFSPDDVSIESAASEHRRERAAAQPATRSEAPSFVYRFRAAYWEARIRTQAVDLLEQRKRYWEAALLLRELLCCPAVYASKRGHWWFRLSVDLDHLKLKESSLRAAELGVRDERVRKLGDQVYSEMENKLRIVTVRVSSSGVGDRSRGRFATPADFPRHDGTSYRRLRVRRWGLGFCPLFKGHFLSRRANPNVTIRIFFIRCKVALKRRVVRLSKPPLRHAKPPYADAIMQDPPSVRNPTKFPSRVCGWRLTELLRSSICWFQLHRTAHGDSSRMGSSRCGGALSLVSAMPRGAEQCLRSPAAGRDAR